MSEQSAPEVIEESHTDSDQVMIEAAHLSKFYGPFTATRDVNFTITRGEVVAFLGPNGAGKSTTMKLLTGYLAPSEGSAWIAGYNMSTHRIQGSEQLGYLPETGPLYPDMTPNSLLRFFAGARGMSRQQTEDRIEVVVDLCDLSSVFHKAIGKLSKGFRQRVGMAQALLHDPDVLIMDEPTAALGVPEQRKVLELIDKLRSQKIGIIFISHNLNDIFAASDRILVLRQGRVVGENKISETSREEVVSQMVSG